MRFLIIGDIVGKPGRKAVCSLLPAIRNRENPDVVIANIENAAGGFGITRKIYEELKSYGIDFFTSGNHIWDRKEIFKFIDEAENLLRPANYPEGVPGRGYIICKHNKTKFALINLMGRIFLDPNLDNPFKIFDKIYSEISKEVNTILVDFHAETTSEKKAFAIYVDGRASLVYGTHTHVQTADECILNHGTAYITDVGMTGSFYSVIGMDPSGPLKRFLTALPQKFEVEEKEQVILNGIVVDIDDERGKALYIKRITEFLK